MSSEKKIIPQVPVEELEKELREELFLRKTNKAGNEIYIFSHDQAPALMREVGRLREVSFRDAGGGTGKEIDVDSYDFAEVPFKQLIVWDPQGKAIIGGYRYILGKNTQRDENGKPITPTSKLFTISDKFIDEYWNETIELGRSFVQPLDRIRFLWLTGFLQIDPLITSESMIGRLTLLLSNGLILCYNYITRYYITINCVQDHNSQESQKQMSM